MTSETPLDGNLYLWFSFYDPQGNYSSSILSEEVEYWLIKEFLCNDGDGMVSVRLIQDSLLTSSCHGDTFLREQNRLRKRRRLALPADMVVLWNFPTSDITTAKLYPQQQEEQEQEQTKEDASSSVPLAYSLWNVSFPIYDWGSANDPTLVQKDMQHLLEQKLWNKELGVPIPGSHVSIQGDEQEGFSIPILLATMSPTATTAIQPGGMTPPLLSGPRKIEPREAHVLIVIGAVLIVLQTIFSLLLHRYGKNFRASQEQQQQQQQKEREALLNEGQGVDQMLRASKGFVEIDRRLVTIEPSEQLVVSSERPSTTNKKPNGGRTVTKNKEAHEKNKSKSKTAAITKDPTDEKQKDVTMKERRRSSSSHHVKKKERDSISSTKQKERHSISSMEQKKEAKDTHAKKNHHRRHSHEVGKRKQQRHSHSSSSSSRHREKGRNQDTTPLRRSEGTIDEAKMFFEKLSTSSVGPTTGAMAKKNQRTSHAIDDTQAL
ncbi:unnamed protein product [Cylindrotheca closterium]|uniref:Uncharacterized protein n=1 Tax=Cylindrotheca closterium TaxID=2856 RepID=A0AAD2GAW0_9STRA|nr:unnamed protein product [Cylindrotheca closterium]